MLKDNLKKALAPLNLEKVAEGDYAKTGYHLEVTAEPTQMVEVATRPTIALTGSSRPLILIFQPSLKGRGISGFITRIPSNT